MPVTMTVTGTSRIYHGFGPTPVGRAEKAEFARRLAAPGGSSRDARENRARAQDEPKPSRNETQAKRTPMVALPSSQFAAQVIGQVLPAGRMSSREALRGYADAAGVCEANFEVEVV